jgi:hypothetical protein
VDWSDPREAADALGESYYSGRWATRVTADDDLPKGFHIEEDSLELMERSDSHEWDDE